MYIVRWQFQARFGHVKEVLGIMRKWEVDVGQRVGWRAANMRVLQGMIGSTRSTIELETRCDSLGDLEASFSDMEKNPNHVEAMRSLEKFVVSGTDNWTVFQVVDLFED